MKKILLILTLALLILPFSGNAQNYAGIHSLYTATNDNDDPDGDRSDWLTWAKNSSYYGHHWVTDVFGPFYRYTPSDLTNHIGEYISRIRVRIQNFSEEPTVFWAPPHVRVYVGGSVYGTPGDLEFDYGTLVVDQEITDLRLGGNNFVDLVTPVKITGTEEIWFGAVYFWESGYPVANINYEINPNPSYQANKSDLVYFGGDYDDFFSVTETSSGPGYCWILAAWVTCEGPNNLQINLTNECHAELSWNAPSDNPNAVYNISRDGVSLVSGHAQTTYTDQSNFDPVLSHTWTVTAACEPSGESFPVSKTPAPCANCPAPNNLTLGYIEDCAAVLITWTAGPDATSFDIKRNNQTIVTGLKEKTYTDYDYSHGVKNTYTVISNCDAGSVGTTKEIGPCVGINENVFNFSIHPNPANNEVTISASSIINNIDVINFLGQTVVSQKANDSQTTLDISTLTGGVYFVRVISDNGTNVQKFVKK
jgi:hypothetical protein